MSCSDHNASDGRIENFLREVYQKSNPRNVMSVFVTGGGSTSLEWLFTVPGASRSLMDAGVVYSRSALNAFIKGNTNELLVSACSSSTALIMADASWRHASEYLLADSRDFNTLRNCQIFGVSCTASLVSESPKKGAHRVFVATASQAVSRVYSVEFDKGRRSREGEDMACSRLMLEAIAKCGGVEPLPVDYLYQPVEIPGQTFACAEVVKTTTVERTDVLERIYKRDVQQALFIKRRAGEGGASSSSQGSSTGNVDMKYSGTSGEDGFDINDRFVVLEDVSLPKGTLVFPGSFNPVHEGHVALVVAALQKLSMSLPPSDRWSSPNTPDCSDSETDSPSENWKRIPVIFEIAAINADKPPLPRDEVMRRIAQFDPFTNPALLAAGLTNVAVCVTSEPLFLEKSKLFADCNFLIGSDTMSRIIDPKYYNAGTEAGDEASQRQQQACAMVSALSAIKERGCRFIVGGRVASPSGPSGDQQQFNTLESIRASSAIALPNTLLTSLFEGLTEMEFRVDLSSTDLRNKKV